LDPRPVPARRCFQPEGAATRASGEVTREGRPPRVRLRTSGRCTQGAPAARCPIRRPPAHATDGPRSRRRRHGLPNPPIGDPEAGGGFFLRFPPPPDPAATRVARSTWSARRPNRPAPQRQPCHEDNTSQRQDAERRHGRRHRRPSRRRPRLRRRGRLSETAYRLGCPASRLGRRTGGQFGPPREAAPATLEGRRYVDVHTGSRDWRDKSCGGYTTARRPG
jgi:hypothetical protein